MTIVSNNPLGIQQRMDERTGQAPVWTTKVLCPPIRELWVKRRIK
jgi:hypothetical protein